MPLIEAMVTLPYFTNLPRDVITNRFHFNSDAPLTPVKAGLISTRMSTLYNSIYGPAAADRANYVNWAQANVKCYDLGTPAPRVPIVNPITFTGGGTAAVGIATEVAVVTTWRAAPVAGVRFQSLYNRIYLGAVPTSWIEASTAAQFPRLLAARATTINNAMAALLNANTIGLEWVQLGSLGGLSVFRPIVGGWTDNGLDTQRRRSTDASARTNWSAP